MGAPTDDDRVEVTRRFLLGITQGHDANQLVDEIAELHVRNNTFPGEVLMELAADALDLAGLNRDSHIPYRQLHSTHLPEIQLRGKEQQRLQYAVLTAFAVHGGLEPDLLDEVTYWIDSYWQHALYAAVAIIRSSAEHTGTPLDTFVTDLAASHNNRPN